jgi:hypothetical protein
MVTIEQFKKVCLTKKPLFGVEINMEIIKFFPDIFETTTFRSRVKRGRPRVLEESIRSKNCRYFKAEDCFVTKKEAEEELAKRLTEKLEKLRNGRRRNDTERDAGIPVCGGVLINNGPGDSPTLMLCDSARSQTSVRVRRVHPGRAKTKSAKAKKRQNR